VHVGFLPGVHVASESTELWLIMIVLFCSGRPERWENIPEEVKAIPGLYANILTFLNGNPLGGNRACIGYKFALLE
jgi:hypothetical protein